MAACYHSNNPFRPYLKTPQEYRALRRRLWDDPNAQRDTVELFDLILYEKPSRAVPPLPRSKGLSLLDYDIEYLNYPTNSLRSKRKRTGENTTVFRNPTRRHSIIPLALPPPPQSTFQPRDPDAMSIDGPDSDQDEMDTLVQDMDESFRKSKLAKESQRADLELLAMGVPANDHEEWIIENWYFKPDLRRQATLLRGVERLKAIKQYRENVKRAERGEAPFIDIGDEEGVRLRNLLCRTPEQAGKLDWMGEKWVWGNNWWERRPY